MSRALVRLQTYFRGWVGRLEATAKRIERDAALRRAYFDLCATTIQRHWRGHYSRTNIHDFHARKAYLAAVLRKGHEIREESLRISKVSSPGGNRHVAYAATFRLEDICFVQPHL